MSGIDPSALLAALMVASTPLLLAALGELVVERSGVLNLGVEGMMITGAVCGFIVSISTNSPLLGFAGAALGGAAISVVFALLVLGLMTNQVATGLALTLFGLGLSALLGRNYVGEKSPVLGRMDLGPLSDLPFLGRAVFSHDIIVYFGIAAVALIWLFLARTRGGLVLRAVGENAPAAHALGYNVRRVRFLAIMFGGAMAGLGGGYLSLVRVPQWSEGMTAGIGWIALAIVVFASWRPRRCLMGAWLFGGVSVMQMNLQGAGVNIPVAVLSMLPYLATIVVLIFMKSARAPGSLGQPFHASS